MKKGQISKRNKKSPASREFFCSPRPHFPVPPYSRPHTVERAALSCYPEVGPARRLRNILLFNTEVNLRNSDTCQRVDTILHVFHELLCDSMLFTESSQVKCIKINWRTYNGIYVRCEE